MYQSIDERRIIADPDRDHTISTTRHRDMAVAATGNCRTTSVRAPDRRSDSSSTIVQPHSTITMSDSKHASIGQRCYRIPGPITP